MSAPIRVFDAPALGAPQKRPRPPDSPVVTLRGILEHFIYPKAARQHRAGSNDFAIVTLRSASGNDLFRLKFDPAPKCVAAPCQSY